MTHAVVTVEIDSKTRVDLALPLDIPNHALANAIAQALEVDKEGKQQYSSPSRPSREWCACLPNPRWGMRASWMGFICNSSMRRMLPHPAR